MLPPAQTSKRLASPVSVELDLAYGRFRTDKYAPESSSATLSDTTLVNEHPSNTYSIQHPPSHASQSDGDTVQPPPPESDDDLPDEVVFQQVPPKRVPPPPKELVRSYRKAMALTVQKLRAQGHYVPQAQLLEQLVRGSHKTKLAIDTFRDVTWEDLDAAALQAAHVAIASFDPVGLLTTFMSPFCNAAGAAMYAAGTATGTAIASAGGFVLQVVEGVLGYGIPPVLFLCVGFKVVAIREAYMGDTQTQAQATTGFATPFVETVIEVEDEAKVSPFDQFLAQTQAENEAKLMKTKKRKRASDPEDESPTRKMARAGQDFAPKGVRPALSTKVRAALTKAARAFGDTSLGMTGPKPRHLEELPVGATDVRQAKRKSEDDPAKATKKQKLMLMD